MGWWSKTWKKVKNVFKKVTKVVKKVVKAVGKTAKKVWGKVKGVAKKFSKGVSKLGPFANIAMNFIPGFGQLWQAYGIWGQLAKGAVTGFALSGGSAKGALLGAATMGAADIFSKMPGTGIAEKVGNWFEGWKDTSAISKAGNFHMKGGELIAGKAPVGTKMMGRSSNAYGFAETQLNKNLAGTSYWADRAAASKAGTTFDAKAYDDIFKQVDIDATNYNQGYTSRERAIEDSNKPQKSLLDKFKDSIPDMSKIKPMDSAQATAGMWNPDTSPLNSVGTNTAAGETHGQAGFGKDANEELIRRLGLVSLLDQYNTSRQTYMA